MKIGSLQICKLHVHADFMGEKILQVQCLKLITVRNYGRLLVPKCLKSEHFLMQKVLLNEDKLSWFFTKNH